MSPGYVGEFGYMMQKRTTSTGGVDATAIKRLRALEQENGRLKRILAQRDLEADV